ncbi:2675_t:CDS:2, partial [Dentiscutata heterogama]
MALDKTYKQGIDLREQTGEIETCRKGNKADLIECLMTASGLAQPWQNISDETMDGMEGEVFREDDTNQEGIFCGGSPTFSMLAKALSNDELHEKKSKRVKREAKDVGNIKALLNKIKHFIRTKTLDRTVVLNVAKDFGWEVAVELSQLKNEGLSAYSETIEWARQAANLKQQ